MGVWTEEERWSFEQVFAERLEEQLAPSERVSVEGETRAEAVEAKLVLSGGASGARVVIEAKVELEKAGLDAEAARFLALDALDLVLLEYLDSGREMRFRGVWEERELEGKALSVRAERTFPELEAQADALLGPDRGD
ncbi:MAG TPA: hypothetical protein DFS52_24830 [Myxococcales bacterium]|nr:hypothetical protein [Myxococcales bacterium]